MVPTKNYSITAFIAQTSILLLPGMPIVKNCHEHHKVGNQANVAMRNDMSIQEMQDIFGCVESNVFGKFRI